MNNINLINKTFKNKVVLVTGHTGFKGTWLIAWLELLGAKVTGISVDIPTNPSHFVKSKLSKKINDLRFDIKSNKVSKTIKKLKPDFIFHLAAQSLVTKSFDDPILTWNTNVLGTANVLQSLIKHNKKCVALFITSDKCYDNKEWEWGYRETDQLGGSDLYSGSKAATEILINSYKHSFFSNNKFIKIASARAGNVIGGGDWSSNRIIPDIIRGWNKNEDVLIRNPSATRPWQHVLEPLSGYLALAAHMYKNKDLHGEAFNFGPSDGQINTVSNVINAIKEYLPKNALRLKKANIIMNEHHYLKLNCDKALNLLNWNASLNFEETIKFTMEWYLKYYNNPNHVYDTTMKQIKEYIKIASIRNIKY